MRTPAFDDGEDLDHLLGLGGPVEPDGEFDDLLDDDEVHGQPRLSTTATSRNPTKPTKPSISRTHTPTWLRDVYAEKKEQLQRQLDFGANRPKCYENGTDTPLPQTLFIRAVNGVYGRSIFVSFS